MMRNNADRLNPSNNNILGGGVTVKALSAAVLAGTVIIGASSVNASELDLSNKPLTAPTLDYLKDNNKDIPQVKYDDEGNFVEADSVKSPGSVYSVTAGSESDNDFSYQTSDADGNITTHYVKIDLKDLSASLSGKNITWEEVSSSGDNTIAVKLSDNITKYYKYTYNEDKYADVAERINDTLGSSNVTNVIFKDLQSSSSGGAIYNTADNSNINITADFISNTISSRYYNGYGGAILNNSGKIGNIAGDFIYNSVSSSGGDVYSGAIYNNSNSTIGNITGNFINNSASSSDTYCHVYGGAIYNNSNSTIGNITGNFINNSASSSGSLISSIYGGAIYNNSNSTIGSITGNFINNTISSGDYGYGGAIYNDNSNIGNITGDFINNSAVTKDGSGGAIYNKTGNIGNITGDFIGNSSYYAGGAIYNNEGHIGDITGNFINNVSLRESSTDKDGNITTALGSAIYNNKGTIGNIKGNFIANKNARALENIGGTIKSIQGSFLNNDTGGLMNTGTITNVNGDYVSNATLYSGGAINNTGTLSFVKGNIVANNAGQRGAGVSNSGTITAFEGNFINNNAKIYGGGLYNTGKVGSLKANFIGNRLTNYAFASGGAIQNGAAKFVGNIGTIEGNFVDNYVEADSSLPVPTWDKGAYYAQGGAIFNINGSNIDKIKGNFSNNYVKSKDYADGGAIHNSIGSTIGEIEGSFEKNHVIVDDDSDDYSQGGAIQNLASSKIGKITGDFVGNYTQGALASSGGAIMNSKTAQIDSIKGNFIGNYSKAGETGNYSQGGAIYNSTSAVLKNIEGDFRGNYVYGTNTGGGGAIYNNDAVVEKVTGNFSGNYAAAKTYAAGGAISNYYGKFNSINGSFTNNYAKSENGAAKGGAIFSLGTMTLVAENGKTNLIDGNYVEDRNGKRNEAIYVSTGQGYQTKPVELKKVDGSGFGFYNKYTNYDAENIPPAIDSAFNIVAKDNGTFVINDMINGDSEPGSVDYDITTYYANWNSSQKVYVDLDDNFLVRETVTTDSDWDGDLWTYIYTSTLTYTNENGDLLGTEVVLTKNSSDGEVLSTTYYDADGNEIAKLPFEKTQKFSSGTLEYNLNFDGDNSGKIYLNNNVLGGANVTLSNTNLHLGKDNVLDGNKLTFNSGTLGMINNQVGVSNPYSLTVNDNTNFIGDVDLKNKVMDRFETENYGEHTGNVNVVGMNLLSDANPDENVTAVYFAQPGLKNNVTNGIVNGEIPQSDYQAVVYSPIYKYSVTYDNVNQYDGKGDGGYFLFTRGAQIGGNTPSNPSDNFNPAVLATPVASVAASQSTINETFKYVFEHADAFTQLPQMDRLSKIEANKYALAEQEYNGVSTDYNKNLGSFNYDESNKAYWVRPYTTFEDMHLKNGPKVSAVTYGTLVGYDGDFKEMKHGWHRIGTGYLGYNGSQLKYQGARTTMNGGLLGMTETWYKGDFWSALTLSAGANVGESHTMYGKEDYVSLMAGVGSKTGYNFEFKEGKYILQPIMFMSYTFVNTFDFTNAAGVRIRPKAAHSIQLNPSVRFVANCKKGWQPYASVGMVWNVMNKADVTANGVRLPEMGVKPYVEYGLGVQRNWDEKYTAFFQTMVRNGGRKGVALTAGFRWALDRDKDKDKVQNSSPQRKVVKQMSEQQKMALGLKPQNTTRTTSSAVLKQL